MHNLVEYTQPQYQQFLNKYNRENPPEPEEKPSDRRLYEMLYPPRIEKPATIKEPEEPAMTAGEKRIYDMLSAQISELKDKVRKLEEANTQSGIC